MTIFHDIGINGGKKIEVCALWGFTVEIASGSGDTLATLAQGATREDAIEEMEEFLTHAAEALERLRTIKKQRWVDGHFIDVEDDE